MPALPAPSGRASILQDGIEAANVTIASPFGSFPQRCHARDR